MIIFLKKIKNEKKYLNNIVSKSLPQYIAKPYIFYEELIKNSLREFKKFKFVRFMFWLWSTLFYWCY